MDCPLCGRKNSDLRTKCEYCGENLREEPIEKFDLVKVLLTEQGQLPTRGNTVGEGFKGIGTSIMGAVGILVFCIIVVGLGGKYAPELLRSFGIFLAPVALALIIGLPVASIVKIAKGAAAANIKHTCSICGLEHTIIASHKNYLCPQCGTLVRTGIGQSEALVRVVCPVCASHWQSPPDAGDMECHGCGNVITISEGKATLKAGTKPCPACGQLVHEASAFCPACGALINKPYLTNYKVILRRNGKVFTPPYVPNSPGYLPKGMEWFMVWQVSPPCYLMKALWIARYIRDYSQNIIFSTHMMHIGLLMSAFYFIHTAIDADSSLLPMASDILRQCENAFKINLNSAIDNQTGKFKSPRVEAGPGEFSVSGEESELNKVNRLLYIVPAEYNALAKRLGIESYWHIPLYQINAEALRNNSGLITYAYNMSVSLWDNIKSENTLFTPLDGDIPDIHFKFKAS